MDGKVNAISIEKTKRIIIPPLIFKIILFLLLAVGFIFYFKLFFSTGIYFDDTFLKKETLSLDTHYMGKTEYGNIYITVTKMGDNPNSVEVIYELPNEINREYIVTFKDMIDENFDIIQIEYGDGSTVFEGQYSKDNNFLIDKSGDLVMDNLGGIITKYTNPYNEDYAVPLKNVADLASFSKDTIRGRYDLLLLAILLFAITLIDVKFPLFFFNLSHILSVKDPEPSDFYITMQIISWFVYPIIGVVLMIVAIT